MDSTNLIFFDVFSGIGGFKIGLEQAGFKSIGFCDNAVTVNVVDVVALRLRSAIYGK